MPRILLLTFLLFVVVISGCSQSTKSTKSKLAPSSRDPFIGKWIGEYSGTKDELIIEKGSTDLEFLITIHASFGNPDKVKGKLVASDRIEIQKQTMGGAPGTAVITLVNGKIQYQQTGFGITVHGKDYEKQ